MVSSCGYPHDQLEHCVGGMSAVTATFFQHWTEDALHVPFYICDGLHVSVQLRIFVSDLDSQRGAFAAKGSAGLKPCIFCGNCLMGNAEGAARNEHFRTIAEHDMTFFQKNDRSDLEATIKYWIGLLPRMSKQEISLRERCLGFNLDPHSVWNYPPAVLDTFNIDAIMNDAMHCYFATGICNSEIILLLASSKRSHGGYRARSMRGLPRCAMEASRCQGKSSVAKTPVETCIFWVWHVQRFWLTNGSVNASAAMDCRERLDGNPSNATILLVLSSSVQVRGCVECLRWHKQLGTTESCASRASETLCSLVPGECETKASSPPAFTRAICKTRLSSDVLGRRKAVIVTTNLRLRPI